MSDLKSAFDAAAASVQNLPSQPGQEDMLELYAYFKQATKGDAGSDRPGMFDLVGRAKYDAWSKLKGTSTDEAMQSYIDLVKRLESES